MIKAPGAGGYHKYLIGRLKLAAVLVLCTSALGVFASVYDIFFGVGWNLGTPGLVVCATVFIVVAILFTVVSFAGREYLPKQ